MTKREYDAAVRIRFESDKDAEWDALDEQQQHDLWNAGGMYKKWEKAHDCSKYADFSASSCVICGAEKPAWKDTTKSWFMNV